MSKKKHPAEGESGETKAKDPKIVIVVTDGDRRAAKAIERAAEKLGMYVIKDSAGAPTRAMAEDVEREIEEATTEIVVVMADDGGQVGEGAGERLVKALGEHGLISAAVAAASNTPGVRKIIVLESITEQGGRTKQAVNKLGRRQKHKMLSGDTAECLADLQVPVIGIGDPGKIGADRKGARAIERALREAAEAARRNLPKDER